MPFSVCKLCAIYSHGMRKNVLPKKNVLWYSIFIKKLQLPPLHRGIYLARE